MTCLLKVPMVHQLRLNDQRVRYVFLIRVVSAKFSEPFKRILASGQFLFEADLFCSQSAPIQYRAWRLGSSARA